MRQLFKGLLLVCVCSWVSELCEAQTKKDAPLADAGKTEGNKAAPAAGAPAARPTMQKYAENVSILLQNMSALDSNPSKEQRNKVIQALTTLKGLSHDVQPTMAAYAVDPVMRYLSFDLPKQFSRIEAAYTSSNYSYARLLLRQTTQYCVGCHAASANKSSAVAAFAEPIQNLSDLEKAEYFGATRRHEEAMLAYERFLSDKKFKMSQPELWEKAVKNLMAITIRIRNDAHITLEMASALLDEGGYSPQQKEMLQVWRTSAKAWSQENISQKLVGNELLNKAELLIDKGQKLSVKGPHLGYIEFMRAMTLLNELAMSDAKDALKARSFLLTGQTSENLREVFIWMHPEAYYEACIRLMPHSQEAKDCSKRLESYQIQQKDPILEKEKLQQLINLAK